MSDNSEELEGDVEDFDGDADLSEWASMGEESGGTTVPNVRTTSLPSRAPEKKMIMSQSGSQPKEPPVFSTNQSSSSNITKKPANANSTNRSSSSNNAKKSPNASSTNQSSSSVIPKKPPNDNSTIESSSSNTLKKPPIDNSTVESSSSDISEKPSNDNSTIKSSSTNTTKEPSNDNPTVERSSSNDAKAPSPSNQGSKAKIEPKSTSTPKPISRSDRSWDTSLSDIMGAFQSLDYDATSVSRVKPSAVASKKPHNLQQSQTLGSITPMKRKADFSSPTASKRRADSGRNAAAPKRKVDPVPDKDVGKAKLRKGASDSDSLGFRDAGSKSDAANLEKDKDKSDKISPFSEEELRKLDDHLVDEIIDGIKKQMFLRMAKGDRYVVTFAPVELADLAYDSVQRLIEYQPNLAFFFKRQGKFKKKKGYAQACFTITSDVRKFIHKLMHVKLSEPNTEVSVAAILNGGKQNVQASFVLSSNNKSKLVGLLDSKEDFSKPVPMASKVSFQLEKVSIDATPSLIILLFPFASSINFSYGNDKAKDMEIGYKGPVNVYYLNQQWMEAVRACCSEFRYNGFPLSIVQSEKQNPEMQKSSPEVKAEDPKGSTDSDQPAQPESLTVEEKSSSIVQGADSKRARRASSNSAKSGSDCGDDDISNMTLDVCAGMMESLYKLKEMGTDNPNVLKILEMQSQLAQLQKSLTKKTKQDSVKPAQDSGQPNKPVAVGAPEKAKGLNNKPSREERRKLTEEERKKMEIELVEAKLQSVDQRDEASEQRMKQQMEEEKAKMREIEERRKSRWAKEMLEEARQKGIQGKTTSKAAQKILQTMAEKRRAEEEMEVARQKEQDSSSSTNEVQPDKQNEQKPPRFTNEMQCAEQTEQKPLGSTNEVQAPDASSRDTETKKVEPTEAKPLIDEKNQGGDTSAQDWNTSGIQDLGTMSFQEKFQPMASLLESIPGRSTRSSRTRSDGAERSSAPQQRGNASDKDDGCLSRLEDFHKELARKGVLPSVKGGARHRLTVSPDRPRHEGTPVYTEKEYQLRTKKDGDDGLPQDFFIQTTFLPNRRCPVPGCPASKVFKTEPMFLDHWDMFHKSTVTMRFCRRCSAYFLHSNELHAHLRKAHAVIERVASTMVAEARVKIVSNPSYRDPGKFLAPPT